MPGASVSRVATDAVIDDLGTAVSPMLVGDGEAPDNADLATRPYLQVNVAAGSISAPLSHDDRWIRHVIDVYGTALSRDAAEWARDEARTALLARTLTVEGATVTDVVLELTYQVQRDDDARTDPVFRAGDRYAIHLDTGA